MTKKKVRTEIQITMQSNLFPRTLVLVPQFYFTVVISGCFCCTYFQHVFNLLLFNLCLHLSARQIPYTVKSIKIPRMFFSMC